MPILQCSIVAIFYRIASDHEWLLYDYRLLIPCLYVGLLGGEVYVNAYVRINSDINPWSRRELAIGAASAADGMGIVLANFLGLYVQSCLYDVNGIGGATVSCPVS